MENKKIPKLTSIFDNQTNKNNSNNTNKEFKYYNKNLFLELTPMNIIDIFIKYNIPVAKETIEELKKHPYYYIKKDIHF